MRSHLAPPVLIACATACTTTQPPPYGAIVDSGYFDEPTITCCMPSPIPACCMQLGGIEIDGVCTPTCNIPDPNAPGWKMTNDDFGCPIWSRPVSPFSCTASDAETCAPRDVSHYIPGMPVPPASPISSCSSQDLVAFFESCLGPQSSPNSCNAQQMTNATCTRCLLTASVASAWGPIVTTGTTWDLNVAGCVALMTVGADGGDCAAKASAAAGCEATACTACPYVDGDNPLPRQQCFQSADVGGCASYVNAECDPTAGGFSVCRASITSQDEFVAFASLFCNP